MKTLIWKEFRENILTFLLLLGLGVLLTAALHLIDKENLDALVVLLFIITCPLVLLIWGMFAISGEVTQNTFPFLAGLPVPRLTIWGAKLLSGLLFGAGLYGFFYLLVRLVGVETISNHFFDLHLPILSPVFIMGGWPLLTLGLGLLGGLLPEAPRVAVISILLASFALLAYIGALPFLNIFWFIPLSCGTILLSSAITFHRSRLLFSSQATWTGVMALVVFGTAAMGIWKVADSAAHAAIPSAPLRFISPIGSFDGGKTVVISARYESPWWDPISSERKDCLLQIGVATPSVAVFADREATLESVAPQGIYFGHSRYQWPGLLGQTHLFIKTSQGAQRVVPGTFNDAFLLGDNLFFRRETREVGGNINRSISLLNPSSEIRDLCPLSQAQANAGFSATRHGYAMLTQEKSLVLIGLEDGIQRELDIPEGKFPQHMLELDQGFLIRAVIPAASPSAPVADQVLSTGGEASPSTSLPAPAREYRYSLVDRARNIRALPWIPNDIRFVGEPQGNIAWGTFLRASPEDPTIVSVILAQLDFGQEKITDIATYLNCGWQSHSTVQDISGQEIVFCGRKNGKLWFWKQNLTNPEDSWEMEGPPVLTTNLLNIGPRQYVFEDNSVLYLLDTFHKSTRQIFPVEG